MKTEDSVVQGYDRLAQAFAARVDTKAHNAYYDRPATLSLLPPVSGSRVLDAGCGPGVYSEWLADHGASVVAVDASPKMVALARRRLGEKADVRRADLTQPLSDFAAGSFDGVVSALVLDYIRDWDRVLGEFRRVLNPKGWLVFSVEHPFDQFYERPQATSYFATERITHTFDWPELPDPIRIPLYRRPLAAMLQPLLAAGFALSAILEPQPSPEFKLLEPADYAKLMRQPGFICFRAKVTN
jgi:ubiquinone/menaquinone biosynthesis C-methylase UbiE